MKKTVCSLAALLSLVAAPSAQAAGGNAAGNIYVNVSPRIRYQTVEGWGASLCWWASVFGKWQDEKKIDEVIDLVTSPDKLNMNVFRYNIGGGDDPSHLSRPGAPGHMSEEKGGKGVRAEMEGFKASADAPYDWARDQGQIKILLKIKQKRPDVIFEAFSNSPPYWMTYSGCSAGNDPSTADNLKPEYYDAFCDYLVAVCKHFKEAYGIEFRTLEPFNESLSKYWRYMGSQEGCHFEPQTQIEIIKRLYPKLKAAGLKTKIATSDESALPQFIRILNAYMDDGKVLKYIGQLNTHSYDATDAQRMTINELVRMTGKPFWQSETGVFERDGFVSNLTLGQKCISDMRLMRPIAWLDWQVAAPIETWGVITSDLDNPDGTYKLSRYYYVRMQFTRFIRQGYTIIDTDQENTLAAVSPSGRELVVCFINLTDKEQKVHYTLNAFTPNAPAELYVTTSTLGCQKVDPVAAGADGTLEFTAEGRSVSTMVVPGAMRRGVH